MNNIQVLSSYAAFVITNLAIAFAYLSNLGDAQPVHELICITGPMTLIYLLSSHWVSFYFGVVVVSLLIAFGLWVALMKFSGVKKLVSGAVLAAFWPLSGLFSLGISYYG